MSTGHGVRHLRYFEKDSEFCVDNRLVVIESLLTLDMVFMFNGCRQILTNPC